MALVYLVSGCENPKFGDDRVFTLSHSEGKVTLTPDLSYEERLLARSAGAENEWTGIPRSDVTITLISKEDHREKFIRSLHFSNTSIL